MPRAEGGRGEVNLPPFKGFSHTRPRVGGFREPSVMDSHGVGMDLDEFGMIVV